MKTKTPRTDQLVNSLQITNFSLNYPKALERAINLCESLETELSNRQPDIVNPITKSPEHMTDQELKQLIKDEATFTKFNLPGFGYQEALGFSMQLSTSDNKWRTSTSRMSAKQIKCLGEQTIRKQLENRMFHIIRASRPVDDQNADIVNPITISHEESKHTPGPWWASVRGEIGTVPNMEVKVCQSISGATPEEARANAKLIAAAPSLLKALLKIAQRLEAGQTDEWTIAALARIAREAINKPTEEI